MAINLKNRKTKLDERASIYEKRNEDESEKSKWKRMNPSQKITHFKTYYLLPFLIGAAILGLVGYFFYNDVVTREEVVYRCVILNESAFDIPLEEFGDRYIEFLGLDTKRNTPSFHLFFTNSEFASKVGATAATDLTQISSMIYAATLDSMIAAQEDLTSYMENDFAMDLTELLSETELEVLKGHLFIPDTPENEDRHPYGVYLDQSDVYQKIFEDGGGIVERPIFSILFNSKKKEESKKFLYYVFPELQQVAGQ